ncbi:hypothetical protein D3C71_714690 [compost metagenome]
MALLPTRTALLKLPFIEVSTTATWMAPPVDSCALSVAITLVRATMSMFPARLGSPPTPERSITLSPTVAVVLPISLVSINAALPLNTPPAAATTAAPSSVLLNRLLAVTERSLPANKRAPLPTLALTVLSTVFLTAEPLAPAMAALVESALPP